MFYSFDITVPKNTAKADAVVQEVELTSGLVTRVSILFPWGCAGLTHVQILDHEFQIWPSRDDLDFSGNDTIIEFSEAYPLLAPPFTLQIRAWNEDDSYEHTVSVGFEVTDPRLYYSILALGGTVTGPGWISR